MQFRTVQMAKLCAQKLDDISIMGNRIGAVIDPKADYLKGFQKKIIEERLDPMRVTAEILNQERISFENSNKGRASTLIKIILFIS